MSFLKRAVMDMLFNNTPYYPPAEIYMGLQTISGEPTAQDYSRLNVTGVWSRAVDGTVHNVKELPHWQPACSWGDCTSINIYDGKDSSSHLLFTSMLRNKFSAIENQRIVFPENSVRFSFQGAGDYSNDLLNGIFNNEYVECPSKIYLALHSEEGELSGDGYERLDITGSFDQATDDGMVTNFHQLTFSTPLTAWKEVVGAVVYDNAVSGRVIMKVQFKKPIKIGKDENLTINPGSLQFGFMIRG